MRNVTSTKELPTCANRPNRQNRPEAPKAALVRPSAELQEHRQWKYRLIHQDLPRKGAGKFIGGNKAGEDTSNKTRPSDPFKAASVRSLSKT